MNMKKLLAGILLGAMVSVSVLGCGDKQPAAPTAAPTKPAESATPTPEPTQAVADVFAMEGLSTQEVILDMGVGINLGNTMEACGAWIGNADTPVSNFERSWGSPLITKDIIHGYKAAGFGVLRVPVAWSNKMKEDYTIYPELLERVDEIVRWALEEDMYVILNIHWDGGWWENFPTQEEECMKKYTRVWEQLSEYYGKYGDHLMFESLNEEGGWESVWNRYSNAGDKEASYSLLNRINQKFVDIVRASGGNNAERHLLIAGYNTDITLTCDPLYQMPQDPAGKMAVSVHYYNPSTFAILEEDADWGKASKTWGTDAEIAELNRYMDMLATTFVEKGVPVIIGEFGCPVKNKETESVRKYITMVCRAAYERSMCPVLWDVTGAFYSRYTCEFIDKTMLEGMMEVKQIER